MTHANRRQCEADHRSRFSRSGYCPGLDYNELCVRREVLERKSRFENRAVTNGMSALSATSHAHNQTE